MCLDVLSFLLVFFPLFLSPSLSHRPFFFFREKFVPAWGKTCSVIVGIGKRGMRGWVVKRTVRRIVQSAIYLGVVPACTTVSARHCPDCHLSGERGCRVCMYIYSNWFHHDTVHCHYLFNKKQLVSMIIKKSIIASVFVFGKSKFKFFPQRQNRQNSSYYWKYFQKLEFFQKNYHFYVDFCFFNFFPEF